MSVKTIKNDHLFLSEIAEHSRKMNSRQLDTFANELGIATKTLRKIIKKRKTFYPLVLERIEKNWQLIKKA